MTLDQFMTYKTHWDQKKEKEGKTNDTFGKDHKLPTKNFDAGSDNGIDVLHPAR